MIFLFRETLEDFELAEADVDAIVGEIERRRALIVWTPLAEGAATSGEGVG